MVVLKKLDGTPIWIVWYRVIFFFLRENPHTRRRLAVGISGKKTAKDGMNRSLLQFRYSRHSNSRATLSFFSAHCVDFRNFPVPYFRKGYYLHQPLFYREISKYFYYERLRYHSLNDKSKSMKILQSKYIHIYLHTLLTNKRRTFFIISCLCIAHLKYSVIVLQSKLKISPITVKN